MLWDNGWSSCPSRPHKTSALCSHVQLKGRQINSIQAAGRHFPESLARGYGPHSWQLNDGQKHLMTKDTHSKKWRCHMVLYEKLQEENNSHWISVKKGANVRLYMCYVCLQFHTRGCCQCLWMMTEINHQSKKINYYLCRCSNHSWH